MPGFVRSEMLDRLAAETFDVVVIGGGITGAGVALDAATRGLRTALVERDDFASGTSSKSSKLVHGGLRYLQNGDVRLVYEALHERQRLLRNAPHLVEVLPFLIPILTRDGVISRRVAKALGSAMWMYDLTGGWRIGRRHRRLGVDDVAVHLPTAHRDQLAGGYLYFDCAADDARLTLAIARTAAQHGAAVANRCAVVGISKDAAGAAAGVVVDTGDGTIDVRARTVVSATGVWGDQIRSLDRAQPTHTIRPAKGVHVTVPWAKVRNDIAVVIPVPGDRRSLFLVPWGRRPDGTFQHTYVGTTDTDHAGDLDDPQVDGDDLDYVLHALDRAVTTEISRADVTGVWAGLRPLLDDAASERTADLSRTHRVEVGESGVIHVSGGKLTTYRAMAEDTVDQVTRLLGSGRRTRRCRTRRLRLTGAAGYQPSPLPDTNTAAREGAESLPPNDPAGTSRWQTVHLERRYGTEAAEVRSLIALDPDLARPLVEGLPYLRAEAVFAVRAEMATTLTDVLLRRTRAHLFDRDASERSAQEVCELLAAELGWSAEESARQLDEYRTICERERAAAADHLTPTETATRAHHDR